MTPRYDIRRDTIGWTVFEVETDQAVRLAVVAQQGLQMSDAEAMRDMLNSQAFRHDPILWR